jgi:hypothetical protein
MNIFTKSKAIDALKEEWLLQIGMLKISNNKLKSYNILKPISVANTNQHY